ncbi:electron transport complex subunit RsxC [Galenea microaerophila]
MSPLASTLKPWVLKLAPIFPYIKRVLYRFHGGVFPNYRKELSSRHPIYPPFIPTELVLPLQQHVGQTAKPIVKPGDIVHKNQKIADMHKGLGAPIHAPTSGTVIAIENRTLPHPSGLEDVCIVIKPDGQDKAIENVLNTDGRWPETPAKLKQIILEAGIVGMGGAGFPTYAKIPNQSGRIHTLLINGAECEPYITCDDLLMQTQPQQILTGALIVGKALGVKKILCGIEDNKQKATRAMQKAANQLQQLHPEIEIEIISVPTVYPMGGQKQLTYELTGVEVPANAHAVDIGLLMMNVATFAAIENAVENGNPLVSRMVTVTGEGVENPFNIHALLGTPFDSLVNLAKPKQPLDFPLIMGGPMMGFEVQNNQVPVIKTTNCILTNRPYIPEVVLPCIRCGECMDACPVNLLPQQLYWYSRSEEWDKVEKHHIWDCIECGCCSYVCPSNIPLVQYYRHAKSEIKVKKAEEAFAAKAKQRHEQRLARLEKEKQEREARLKAKKDAVKKQASGAHSEGAEKPALSAREKAIQAAKARAAAKKSASAHASQAEQKATSSKPDKSTQSPEDKRTAAMAAAKARAEALRKKKAQANAASSNPEQESN